LLDDLVTIRSRERCEIPRPGCLPAFLAEDAHADISFLNHGDVVGTIANGQRHRAWNFAETGPFGLLHQLYHERLLQRREPAA